MEYHELRVVESPTLVRDHALEKLRRAIGGGLYPPGTRLVERQLCEALGVSRTSVREALRQLQAENLIAVGKRRSIMVAVISSKDADDIYLMRDYLETQAIRSFVERADPKAIQQLVRIHSDLRQVLGQGDVHELALMAGEFYETILTHSGRKVIADMARQLLARVNYLRMRSMAEPRRLEDGMQEWDRMIEAILNRDADAAATAMSEHLANSRRAVVSRLQKDEAEAAIKVPSLPRPPSPNMSS